MWGQVTNAIEDICKVEGMPTRGADLTGFAEVTRLRGEGMTPEEALMEIWNAWSLPGKPPVLDWKQEWSLPRHEPLDDEEAVRQNPLHPCRRTVVATGGTAQ